jgi:hypothetical protein
MYVADRWVYFTTMINWEKDVEVDSETVGAFAAAAQEALARITEVLGARGRGQSEAR